MYRLLYCIIWKWRSHHKIYLSGDHNKRKGAIYWYLIMNNKIIYKQRISSSSSSPLCWLKSSSSSSFDLKGKEKQLCRRVKIECAGVYWDYDIIIISTHMSQKQLTLKIEWSSFLLFITIPPLKKPRMREII